MCEHDPRCTGADDLVGNAFAQIADGRWSVTGVYGDDTAPAVAYTTGLTEHRRPELLVTGLDPDLACRILDRAAELAVADRDLLGSRFLDGVVSPPHRLALLPAIDTVQMHVTRLLYGPDFLAVQLIWPDAHNRFPWESGYAHPASAQPLTGIPPLAA
ncbi:MAG: DUF4262 domain-containing protein [Gordonia sp. (in: high G+C Gram-positive bacteria)]|uniref:DUF4262 domain-containing protein n=1 Tax=Gordonia sp. (in: high G+C Gram-positive bacteria) TaxID=84139 RepID=UPI0039E50D14